VSRVQFRFSDDTIPPVDIALVGFTNSYNDQRWLEMAGAWVAEHDPATAWASARRIVFDLRGACGSNFLDDQREYGAVVLFAIYNPPMHSAQFQRAIARPRGQTSLAENHSRDNWAARLSRTRAKLLFIFRRDDSISGEWLGEIEHYERSPEHAGVFGVSIYRRKSEDGKSANAHRLL
jgi:hypothetical protein